MPIVTISDYSTDPPTSRHPWSRQCPNLRTCFPDLTTSLNPNVDDRPLALRRSSFIAILFFRLIHIFLFLRYYWYSMFNIPIILLDILFFFFMAWNLHLIVDMSGERMVFGVRWGRRSFDAFLWGMAACHVWVVGWDLLMGVAGVYMATWALFDLMILGVAWVATWEAEVSLA